MLQQASRGVHMNSALLCSPCVVIQKVVKLQRQLENVTGFLVGIGLRITSSSLPTADGVMIINCSFQVVKQPHLFQSQEFLNHVVE